MKAKDLTLAQQKALVAAVAGIRKYADGYRCEDNPRCKIAAKTLISLHEKGLVDCDSRGGAPQVILVEATDAGYALYEDELRERKELLPT